MAARVYGLGLREAAGGVRLISGMPRFFRRSITPDEAAAFVRHGLAHREENFLAMLRTLVYPYAWSPYRRLLELAGCDYGDVQRLVQQTGLEGALTTLFQAGVYLSVDEVKGLGPAIRGSAHLEVGPALLRDPRAPAEFAAQSSGRSAAATQVGINLDALRVRAMSTSIVTRARGAESWRLGLVAILGSSALVTLLSQAVLGTVATRWFSPLNPDEKGLTERYLWSVRAARLGARLAGVSLPKPEYVPLGDPLPVARWMRNVLDGGETPWLWGSASWAVAVSQAAGAAGFDLLGAEFTTTGEPTTAARLRAIRGCGGRAVPSYAAIEVGVIGHGCLAPSAPDDVHVVEESLALIQPPTGRGEEKGLPPDALLLTTLDREPRLVLLNAALGDAATVERRACGCSLGAVGWTTHLHGIRSFAKRTAAGMTLLDSDLALVIEQTLPGRFGGGPTDYQLVEDEASDTRTIMTIRVHPRLGPLDEQEVARVFIAAIQQLGDAQRAMASVWRDAGLVRVERREPVAVGGRKIAHRV